MSPSICIFYLVLGHMHDLVKTAMIVAIDCHHLLLPACFMCMQINNVVGGSFLHIHDFDNG